MSHTPQTLDTLSHTPRTHTPRMHTWNRVPRLKQQYNISFGCDMAGVRIPPLIGLCTKPANPIGGPPKFLELRDPMICSLFGDYKDVPPILVVYDKKDKPQLGKLYEEHILKKVQFTHTCNSHQLASTRNTHSDSRLRPYTHTRTQVAAKRRKTMGPGEKLVVLVDGVGGHINQTAKEFKALEQACIEFFKGAANSTSVLQVADLIKMFHNIKVPDQYINKLTQEHWDIVRAGMAELIKDFIDPHFSSPVREAFIDTLTVLFYIIYPSMTQLEIQRKWHSIGGYGSFRSLMSRCKDPPSDQQLQQYESKLDDMKVHWVEHGKITDKIFADKFQIYGDKSVDTKGMKSQRVVHLTHPAVVANTLSVMQKK